MVESPAVVTLPDEAFGRVLCVVAHPDDMEYGASAAVHHWTSGGVQVAYLLLTAGEAGMQAPPDVVAPLRAREQREACDIVGVTALTILDHPDGLLEAGPTLRRSIAREIRQFRPDVVVTGTWEIEVGWGLNHADHRATGLATLDACRDADNAWVFPELTAEEGLATWGPTWLLVHGHPRSTHGVPLTDADVAAAVASLSAHRAYLADLPGHPAPEEFLPELLRQQGRALGTDYAMLFSAHRLR